LQAWHRTYDAILEETEETYLMNSVQQMLDGMATQIPIAAKPIGDGPLKASLYDADYHVTVARSLLSGTNIHSLLGQDALVAQTLKHIADEQLVQEPDFMGFCLGCGLLAIQGARALYPHGAANALLQVHDVAGAN
jgi:hypothetical protein